MNKSSVDALRHDNHELVVLDDDEFTLEVIRRKLRNSNWSVTCFTCADKAMEHLRHADLPDALIVDHRMPRQDGDDFLRELILDAGIVITPTFLCSSVDLPVEISGRVEQLGVRVLSKDVLRDENELLKALEHNRTHR